MAEGWLVVLEGKSGILGRGALGKHHKRQFWQG